MTLVGGASGLTAAGWLGRLVQSLRHELKGSAVGVFVGSAVVLTLVAFGAAFVPAHRASQVDPMRALREGGLAPD